MVGLLGYLTNVDKGKFTESCHRTNLEFNST